MYRPDYHFQYWEELLWILEQFANMCDRSMGHVLAAKVAMSLNSQIYVRFIQSPSKLDPRDYGPSEID